jgi:hypothetical protein
MTIFKINDIIIKMDNYEHQIEHFSVAVDLKEVVAANQCHKPSPPSPPHNMQNGVGVQP